MYEQFKMNCPICEKKFTKKNGAEACHIKSDKHGGTNDKNNAFIACFKCNRDMGSHNMLEWIKLQWGAGSTTYYRIHTMLSTLGKNIH